MRKAELAHLYTKSIREEDAVGFARGSLRAFAVDVANSAMADAFPFAFDTEFLQKLFVFIRFELLFRTVDPDAAETERMGGEQHVAHDETAIVNTDGGGFCG